jgi:hypothetical protein
MRQKGENSVKGAGKCAIPPDEIIISSLGSKVNTSYLADFTAPCGCSAVEAAFCELIANRGKRLQSSN